MSGKPLTLSVLIPAHNEGAGVVQTVQAVYGQLRGAGIPHEILVVLDHCTDDTAVHVNAAMHDVPTLRYTENAGPADTDSRCATACTNSAATRSRS